MSERARVANRFAQWVLTSITCVTTGSCGGTQEPPTIPPNGASPSASATRTKQPPKLSDCGENPILSLLGAALQGSQYSSLIGHIREKCTAGGIKAGIGSLSIAEASLKYCIETELSSNNAADVARQVAERVHQKLVEGSHLAIEQWNRHCEDIIKCGESPCPSTCPTPPIGCNSWDPAKCVCSHCRVTDFKNADAAMCPDMPANTEILVSASGEVEFNCRDGTDCDGNPGKKVTMQFDLLVNDRAIKSGSETTTPPKYKSPFSISGTTSTSMSAKSQAVWAKAVGKSASCGGPDGCTTPTLTSVTFEAKGASPCSSVRLQ